VRGALLFGQAAVKDAIRPGRRARPPLRHAAGVVEVGLRVAAAGLDPGQRANPLLDGEEEVVREIARAVKAVRTEIDLEVDVGEAGDGAAFDRRPVYDNTVGPLGAEDAETRGDEGANEAIKLLVAHEGRLYSTRCHSERSEESGLGVFTAAARSGLKTRPYMVANLPQASASGARHA